MNIVIDFQVGPYDAPADIEAEIARVRRLGEKPEVDEAIATLQEWLEDSKRNHTN